MSREIEISDAVKYSPVHVNSGRYKFQSAKLNNKTGGQITLNQTATELAELKFPASKVYNAGRSRLEYQIEIPAQGAGKHIWAFNDTFEVADSIQYGTASSPDLLTNVNYANRYVSVARKLDTKLQDYLSLEPTSGLSKHNDTPDTNYFPPTVPAPGANNIWDMDNVASNTAIAMLDPKYVRIGGDDKPLVISRSVPLSALTRTALGQDKDVIFPEDMFLRIQMAPFTKIAFVAGSDTDPTAAPAALDPANGDVVVRNIQLQIAFQDDKDIEKGVRDRFKDRKLSFMIPYVNGWQNPTVGVGEFSISIPMNAAYGRHLKRVLHTAFPAPADTRFTYDHQNMNGSKIAEYQTALDSAPLQVSKLSCLQPELGKGHGMDDWRENAYLMKDSAIQGSSSYYLNWFHCDSWADPKPKLTRSVPEDNVFEGLDLTADGELANGSRTWAITMTTKASLTHYTFAEFIRVVHSTPDGVVVAVNV